MNISLNAKQYENLSPSARAMVEEKLAPVARLLGEHEATALLDVELAEAPAEGRSATPTRLTATLTFGSEVARAEAVKPTPESAADRVRAMLEAEVRRRRGKEGAWRRSARRAKDWLRFGR